MRRARELGLPLPGTPGPWNAITDVPGVQVGYSTLIAEVAGKAIRTGVTAILPRAPEQVMHPAWAGTFAMNGNGEMTGCHWIREAGFFTGPITLTNSCSVGMAHHGAVRWLIGQFPGKIGETDWPLPVVAETYDGWLNDIAGLHVQEQHVMHAIDSARSGPIAEGNVGGGTGMIAYEFKAGTGTSSRVVTTRAGKYTLGALVQANHGLRPWLQVCGVPAGKLMPEHPVWTTERGSIIAIVATDAPLLPLQLQRLARRIALGMGRGGTPSGNNSGDLYLAFSTANDAGQYAALAAPNQPALLHFDALANEFMDEMFLATVECVDEAILNAMLAAETMTGKNGRLVRAIDAERLAELVLARDPPRAKA